MFLVQIFLYQICDKRQHVMYDVQCWQAKQIHWFKKNDVPTRAVYFTNEFIIVIQIR